MLAAIVGGLVAFDRLGESEDRLVSPADLLEPDVTPEAGLGPQDGRAPRIDEPAPEFVLRDAEGNARSLADYRGQVVWLNFWATWCEPCKKELPDIQQLADQFAAGGLVVLTVNYQQSPERALNFWDELDLDLPILLDRTGGVYDQYKLQGLPDSFFIDREGVLRALQIGFLKEDEMREKLAEAGIE
ncbi:MAG: TlpA disulfide reductase family protein [Dehalococcoidia bacterium]